MIARCLAGQPMPVYGQGLNVRDWLYVQDHCRAIDLIIRNGRPGQVYNIGGRCERRNIDIVREIRTLLGRPHAQIAYVEDRKGHDLRYAIDASKIAAELGWQPQTDFETGLKKTVAWYLRRRDWWQEICK